MAAAATGIRLSQKELEDLVDREAKQRLGISGERFRSLWKRGKLRDSEAAYEVAMLLNLERRKTPSAGSSNGKR